MTNSDSSSDKDDRQDSMRLPEELDRLDRFDCGLLSGEERGAFLADLYSSRDKRKVLSEMFELELLELPEMEQESPLAASAFEKKGREARASRLVKFSRRLTALTLLVVAGLTARLIGDFDGNFGCGGNRQDIARSAWKPELRETVNELNSDRNDSSDLEERASDFERSNVPAPIMAELSEEPADAELLFAPASAPSTQNGAVSGLKGLEDDEDGAVAFKKGDGAPGRATPEDAGAVLSLSHEPQENMTGGAPTAARATPERRRRKGGGLGGAMGGSAMGAGSFPSGMGATSDGMFMGGMGGGMGGASMGARSFSSAMGDGAATGATSDGMYGGGMGAPTGGMNRGSGMGMIAGAPLADAPDQDEADVPDSASLSDAFALYAFFEAPDESDESREESATSLDRGEKRGRDADVDEKREAIVRLASRLRDRPDELEQYLSGFSAEEKLTLLGVQKAINGDLEAAEQFFRQAYAFNRDGVVAMCNLAIVLDAVGKESEAKELFEKLRTSDEYKESASVQESVRRGERLIPELRRLYEEEQKRKRATEND